MRAFSTVVVASALGIDRRRLDKLVAGGGIDGVRGARQGISRAFSPSAVLAIAVAIELIDCLALPAPRALSVAQAIVANDGEHAPGTGITMRIDLREIERRVAARLTDAVEAHPSPRRGRPPSPRH